MNTSPWSLETSAVSTELKRFIAEKCAQVRAETRAPEHAMIPESQALFAAAANGDWRGVVDALDEMRRCAREPREKLPRTRLVYPAEWAAVNEIGAALGEFGSGEEKYAIAFARDIIASIPPGSIYFGGTDPGRFLVTALSRSHVNADPFFTLTQNALADRRSYLRYLRAMYGGRIYLPSDADANRAFDEYQNDARRRRDEGKLLPGETFEEVDGIEQISGQMAVMAINGALSKLIFEKNPDREFYVEESFPLQWMYPHLTPHGLILKINRQPPPEFSDALVQRDHAYWSRYVAPMLGDWLTSETPLPELIAFVERVYLRHDYDEFGGDPNFVQNDIPQKAFSKLRSSLGGLYVWRAQCAGSPAEKERMLKEAEFAFRQAFALCPASPEAVFRYISLLLGQKRLEDSLLVAQAGARIEGAAEPGPDAPPHVREEFSRKRLIPSQTTPGQRVTQLGNLVEMLQRMRGKF